MFLFWLLFLIPSLCCWYNTGAKAETIPTDVSLCFETRECHVTPVGSFSLTLPIGTGIDAVQEIVEGYLFQVTNGLPYDMHFYWDAYSSHTSLRSSISNNDHEMHLVSVKAGASRYFNSWIKETHTLRLYIKMHKTQTAPRGSGSSGTIKPKPPPSPTNNSTNTTTTTPPEDPVDWDGYELVDRAIGREEKQCGAGKSSKVCDYLFRMCYQGAKNNKDEIDDCEVYELACEEYTSVQEEDETCVESCALTYFSDMMSEKEKESFHFDRLAMVKCIADNQYVQTYIKANKLEGADWQTIALGSGLMNGGVKGQTTDATTSNLNTTIAILASLLAIILLFGIIYVFWIHREKVQHYYRVWKDNGNDGNGERGGPDVEGKIAYA